MTDPTWPIAFPKDCMAMITSYMEYIDVVRLTLTCHRLKESIFHLVQSLKLPRFNESLPNSAASQLHKFNKLIHLGISTQFMTYFDVLAKSNPSLTSIVHSEQYPRFGENNSNLFIDQYQLRNLRTLHLRRFHVVPSDFLTRLANVAPQIEHLMFTILSGFFDASLILRFPKLRSLQVHTSYSDDQQYDLNALKEHPNLIELTLSFWKPETTGLMEATVAELLREIRSFSPSGVDLRLRFGSTEKTVLEMAASRGEFSLPLVEMLRKEGADIKYVRVYHVMSIEALRYFVPHIVGGPTFADDFTVALEQGFCAKNTDYCKELVKYRQPTRLPWESTRIAYPREPKILDQFFAWALSPELNPGGVILSPNELIENFTHYRDRSHREYATALLRSIPINFYDPCFLEVCATLFHKCPKLHIWEEYALVLIDRMNADQKFWFANRVASSHWQQEAFDGPLPYLTLILLSGRAAPATKLIEFVDEKIFHDYFVLPPKMGSVKAEKQQPVRTVLTEMMDTKSSPCLKLLVESKLVRSEDLNVGDPHPLQVAIACCSEDLLLLLQRGCRLSSDIVRWALGKASDTALMSLFVALHECPAQAHIAWFENVSIVYRLCQRRDAPNLVKLFIDLLKAMKVPHTRLIELMNEPFEGTSVPLDAALKNDSTVAGRVQVAVLLVQSGAVVSSEHKQSVKSLLDILPASERSLAAAFPDVL